MRSPESPISQESLDSFLESFQADSLSEMKQRLAEYFHPLIGESTIEAHYDDFEKGTGSIMFGDRKIGTFEIFPFKAVLDKEEMINCLS